MICLDDTDTLEGGASVTNVVDYTVHGLVGSTFTVIADGQLSVTDPSVLYTAGAAISIVSIILVNTHSSAVTCNLYLDSANGGNPRRLIPKDVSLGVGYSLHFDGPQSAVLDASGNLQTLPGLHASKHLSGGDDPITTMVTSTNIITDHRLIRGDGGARGVQETPIIVDDSGRMTNPSQPAFCISLNVAQFDVTGDGTIFDIIGAIWTEIFDQGSNISDGTFTAPITARYRFEALIYLVSFTGAESIANVRLITSNRTYRLVEFSGIDAGTYIFSGSLLVDMDLNDTAYLQVAAFNGAKVVTISTAYTFFSGALNC